MKPSTREWAQKAESDYQAALTLSRRRKRSFHDEVCFHCQQSAEKYLKARLEEAGIFSPKTHDLRRLLNLSLPLEPMWAALLHAVASLSVYAVEFRYPGNEATPQNAKDAKRYARTIRKEARLALGLNG